MANRRDADCRHPSLAELGVPNMKHSWIIHDMIRVCPQTGKAIEEELDCGRDLVLHDTPFAAVTPRNAYISLQVILRLGPDDPAPIRIEAVSLQGEHGGIIDTAEYAYYVQWFHHVRGKYIPDGLIPWGAGCTGNDPVNWMSELNAVPNQSYAAVWVDLFIPANTQPGNYSGLVHVSKGNDTDSHKIALQVLETSIPNETSIFADLNNYADSISPQYAHLKDRKDRYRDGSYFAVEHQYYRMSHEHRALFHNLPYEHSGKLPESFAPELQGAGSTLSVKDWSLFDEHFGPLLDGSAFADTKRGAIPVPYMYLPHNFHWPADYTKFGRKGYRTEFSLILEQFQNHFTEKGWMSTKFELFFNHKKRYKLFPYDGDETRFIWDEKINDIYYDISKATLNRKDAASVIFRTDSSWCYGLHYEKYADIISHWVISDSIFRWYPKGLPYLHAKGNTVWLYASVQALHASLLATAIMPMVCSAIGVQGFNYWNNVGGGLNWHIEPASGGKTSMFYPGDRLFGIHGPIPTIRLKVLRNSMQAAECMEQWIRANGPESRMEIARLVGSILDGDRTFDWPEPPELVNKPPYEWLNENLSEASPTAYHEGRSPELFLVLRDMLWKLLD